MKELYRISINDITLLLNNDNQLFKKNSSASVYYYQKEVLYADLGAFLYFDSRLISDFMKFKQVFFELIKDGSIVYAFIFIVSTPFFFNDNDFIFHFLFLFVCYILTLVFGCIYLFKYIDIKKLKLIKRLVNESWLKVICRMWNLNKTAVKSDIGEKSICAFYKNLG